MGETLKNRSSIIDTNAPPLLDHSYLRASIGFSAAAFRAG